MIFGFILLVAIMAIRLMQACVGNVRLTNGFWFRSLRSLDATARNRDASFTGFAKTANPAPAAVDIQ